MSLTATATVSPAAPARAISEAGFTLAEMAVSLMLLSMVLVAVFSLLDSQTRAERRASALVNSQEDVRIAVQTIGRDLRAADPLLANLATVNRAYQLNLQIGDPAAGPVTTVRWALDPATGDLHRQTLSAPNGTVTATTYTLHRVHNADAGVQLPLFRYYNSSDNELNTQNATVADVASCTIRVHILVQADSNPGPAPFTVETDAQLRNRLPGGVGC